MKNSTIDLSVLHILIAITETSAAYNEHCLPLAGKRDITICTFFRSGLTPPKEIKLYEGDDTLLGFFRVLKVALDENEYDIIHAHSPHVAFLFLIANVIYGKFIRSTVFTVHSSYRKINYKFIYRLALIPIFAIFRRVVCCSHASYESFPWLYKRIAGSRMCTIQNGINIERVDNIIENTQKFHHTGNMVIVTIGRLIDIKNPVNILQAFYLGANKANLLVFIGDGPLRESLETISNKHGFSKQVEYTGLIPRWKVYERLVDADLFVSASLGEGLPVAVLEAMVCRCPVILSDIPPHREIADGADFIHLIYPDDVNGFAREIKRLGELSPEERAAIGENCRKLVIERFSLNTMQQRYQEVYTQALTKHVAG